MQIIIYSRKFNVEKALSSFRVTSILHRSGTASKPNQMLNPNPETRNPKPQDNLWHRFQTKWEEAACLEHPDPRKGPPCVVCVVHIHVCLNVTGVVHIARMSQARMSQARMSQARMSQARMSQVFRASYSRRIENLDTHTVTK